MRRRWPWRAIPSAVPSSERSPCLLGGAVRWPVLKRILKPVTVGSEKKKFRLDASKFPKKKNKKIGEGIPKHQKYVRRVCVCEAVFLARSVVVPHARRVVEDL